METIETLLSTQVQACDAGLLCCKCGKTAKDNRTMRRHMNEAHLPPKRYHCPTCDMILVNRNMYQHISKLHPQWKGVKIDRFLMK